MRVTLAFTAVALLLASQPALADIYNPNQKRTARKAALEYAKQRYGRQGRVSVAGLPLLDTTKGRVSIRPRTPIKAYGVSVNGRQLKEAVVVQGKFNRYQATGVAAVHYLPKPTHDSVRNLGNTFNEAVILRTRARGTKIQAKENLAFKGEGVARGKRSMLLEPRFPAWNPNPIPGPIPEPPVFRPMVYPGPSGYVEGQATIKSRRGETTAKKGFHRFVIMNGGNPAPIAQPAGGAPVAAAAR
jgi:hypothetical protein